MQQAVATRAEASNRLHEESFIKTRIFRRLVSFWWNRDGNFTRNAAIVDTKMHRRSLKILLKSYTVFNSPFVLFSPKIVEKVAEGSSGIFVTNWSYPRILA
jgi:hypothetical protein